mgnify:CR=1 FL=1
MAEMSSEEGKIGLIVWWIGVSSNQFNPEKLQPAGPLSKSGAASFLILDRGSQPIGQTRKIHNMVDLVKYKSIVDT